ncbi:ankyrin repeat-containing protein [Dimargaris xerosporica]|nr:ankyrin repeat-containing protein [Dimargaris xerosporica]
MASQHEISPTESPQQDIGELVECARYGEFDEMRTAVDTLLATHANVFPNASALLVQPNQAGNTALHMAAANGHLEIMQYLLDRLPPTGVNGTNQEGNTALHWASITGNIDAVQLLLNRNADPLLKNAQGRTPMSEAQQLGKESVVKCILDYVDEERITQALDNAGDEGEESNAHDMDS